MNNQSMQVKQNLTTYSFGQVPISFEEEFISAQETHQEMLHWHDSIELIHVRTGSLHCVVNGSNFLLSEGEMCVINADKMHRVYCTEGQECRLDVLSIKPSIVSQHEGLFEHYIQPVVSDPDFTHIRVHHTHSLVRIIADLLGDLQEQGAKKPEGYELHVMGIVFMILSNLYQIYTHEQGEAEAPDSDVALQRRMNRYIYEHFSERIGLDEIARAGGVSRSKCSAMFQKYTQSSPINFLNAYRLEVAAKLLKNTEDAIGDIARACGFSEQSYFNRMFTREFGESPRAYRKTNAGR